MQGVKVDGPFYRVGVVEVLRRGTEHFIVHVHYDSVSDREFEEPQLRALLSKYPRKWPLSYRFAVQCSILSILVHVVIRSVRRRDREARNGRGDRLEHGSDHVIATCEPFLRPRKKISNRKPRTKEVW